MKLFFDRIETTDEILVVHKPYFMYLLAGALLFAFAANEWGDSEILQASSSFIWLFAIITFVWRFISMRAVRKEMMAAMKDNKITFSGSKFNPANPMVVRIAKTQPESE